VVERHSAIVWSDETRTSQMHRSFEELLEFLFRADTFPQGAVLSTGTGLVPGIQFSLEAGDLVSITIEDVGSLVNRVVVGPNPFAVLVSSLTVPHLRPTTP